MPDLEKLFKKTTLQEVQKKAETNSGELDDSKDESYKVSQESQNEEELINEDDYHN